MPIAASEQCRIGIIGLGTAGRLLIPAVNAHPGMTLAAVADPVPAVREAVASQWGVPAFADIESLVAASGIDAVYIATPTQLHAAHTAIAAAAGKHILCEKPMSTNLEESLSMIAAAQRAGVVLMVGHSRSYDAPLQKMREIVAGGSLGRVRLIVQMTYTDWIYRPRRPDELDPDKGGGVTFRQGAHQFDVIRLIAGGLATSVNATTFDWDASRPAIGAHTTTLRFADGAVGNAIYNGYGAFSTAELTSNVGEFGSIDSVSEIGVRRRAHGNTHGDETTAKRERASRADKGAAPHHAAFGLTLVSCEGGDLRQSPDGIFIYSEKGRTEVPVSLALAPRDMVVAEFYDAVTGRRPPLHDGRWGLANLEVCVAATESSRTGREVNLVHQVAVQD